MRFLSRSQLPPCAKGGWSFGTVWLLNDFSFLTTFDTHQQRFRWRHSFRLFSCFCYHALVFLVQLSLVSCLFYWQPSVHEYWNSCYALGCVPAVLRYVLITKAYITLHRVLLPHPAPAWWRLPPAKQYWSGGGSDLFQTMIILLEGLPVLYILLALCTLNSYKILVDTLDGNCRLRIHSLSCFVIDYLEGRALHNLLSLAEDHPQHDDPFLKVHWGIDMSKY